MARLELDDALVELSSGLSENEIRHMVIGGFAGTVWGEPRFTRDLGVTVSGPADKFGQIIGRICARFPSLSGDPLKFVTETRGYRSWLKPSPAMSSLLLYPMEKTGLPQ